MATVSIPSKICPDRPFIDGRRARGHVYVTDQEDKRFKVCGFCGDVKYRTDEEVMGNG